jgi:hypothetical protein
MEDTPGNNHGVLFDVDAMRAELARDQEELQVKELQSTLPPMKIDVPPEYPRNTLRETKSDNATMTLRAAASPYPGTSPRLSREPSPAMPSASFGYQSRNPSQSYGKEDEDDGVQMTFDDSYREPSNIPKPPAKDHSFASTVPDRPEMKSSRTVPNMSLQDPWADEEEDFGKEKEIEMTFA